MCRDAVAIGGGGANPPAGLFNVSVMCILGAFLTVLGILIAKITGVIRSIDRQ
jgi:hypothetical protein